MAAAARGAAALTALGAAWAIPSEPLWFGEQKVDHFSTNNATWRQRYYLQDKYFGGPGSPIFVIMGGEGGIPPDVGIFYPWIAEVLAKTHKALVVEPEHRFYGESLPFGQDSFTLEHLAVMDTQQALADAARLVRAQQAARGCTARGTPGYCPVLTVGGSYPGFLAAMMRLRYPAIVDMAYSASAPMKFYGQAVDQYAYYTRVTESAERSLPGCPAAVKQAFVAFEAFAKDASVADLTKRFSVCSTVPSSMTKDELADNLEFLAQQTFANLNMANYPPDNQTALHRTCVDFAAAAARGGSAVLDAVRDLLLTQTQQVRASHISGKSLLLPYKVEAASPNGCFDLVAHMPAGEHSTARCGDWSGCGNLHDGEMWDYQTCTFEVEHIGFGGSSQMFPDRPWTMEWLRDHCQKRFGKQPEPTELLSLWGFDTAGLKAQTSRIVFTNGLNDGWSVGGLLEDIAPERDIISINLPNGAHHSDLAHSFGQTDTPDVQAAHTRISGLVGKWLQEVRGETSVLV